MAHKLAARCQVRRDFTPVAWTEYFDEAHDVCVDQDQTASFRVYLRNFRPPYAPARHPDDSSSSSTEMTEAELNKFSQFPTLVMLHGGGYSGLTWAQFTRYTEQQCHARFMAVDLRSHGDSKTLDDDKMDIDTLVEDVVQVIHATHRLCGFPETPKIVLIGHSMGGAIAIKCADRCLESLPSLAGFVIIDVVEGTAKDALPIMMSVIKTRPAKFPSLANAIEWSVRSGMAKNVDAARVSMPGNLLNVTTGHLSIHDIDSYQSHSIAKHKFCIDIKNLLSDRSISSPCLPPNLPISPRVALLRFSDDGSKCLPSVEEHRPPCSLESEKTSVIVEEDDGATVETKEGLEEAQAELPGEKSDGGVYRKPPAIEGYCWRTDLAKTQPYWPAWFEGLSEMMLNAPVQGKFLLLAGIDRLDKTLTIGQMQGKFMMRVLPKCGHAVHEDSPERVASVIGEFLVKNKFTTAN